MKSLRVFLFGLLLVSGVCSAHAEGDDRIATQLRSFYQWYIPLLMSAQETDIPKQHHKEMSRYVTANRMAKLARIPADSQEGDFFVNSQDADAGWGKNIEVSNVKIGAKGRATAEVLLTGQESGKRRLKVMLALEGGTFKIDDVEGIPDFGAMASAQLRAFYAQYIHYLAHAIGDETPMGHEDVRQGFTKDGLFKAFTKIKENDKVDYLLQSTDWDPAWEEHIEVKSAEIIPDGTHGTVEVLLTGEKIPKARLKVSLKREKDTYKIDGVEKLGD